MKKLDVALALEAKKTLRDVPNFGLTAKCQRGLAAGERAVTIVTFTDGSVSRLWNNQHGRSVANLARQKGKKVAKVEYVIASGDRGEVIRVAKTFNLIGLELVEA